MFNGRRETKIVEILYKIKKNKTLVKKKTYHYFLRPTSPQTETKAQTASSIIKGK